MPGFSCVSPRHRSYRYGPAGAARQGHADPFEGLVEGRSRVLHGEGYGPLIQTPECRHPGESRDLVPHTRRQSSAHWCSASGIAVPAFAGMTGSGLSERRGVSRPSGRKRGGQPVADRAQLWADVWHRWGGRRDRGGCCRCVRRPVLDRLARALERVAFAIDQPVDRLHQRDVLGTVVAPAAAALERAEHRKLLLPVAEHVLADAEGVRHLTDRAQCLGGLAVVEGERLRHAPLAIRSLSFWLARKVMTRRGVIGTSTPVLGLRPTRSRLSRRMKLPKPEILTFWPSAIALHILARISSTRSRLSAREKPILRLIVSARSARVSVPTDRIMTCVAPQCRTTGDLAAQMAE